MTKREGARSVLSLPIALISIDLPAWCARNNDAKRIRAEQRLHQDMVSVRGDRVRQARRRDAFEVLEVGLRPGADLAAYGPNTARSVPTGDPENPSGLHGLRDRHARHGLV